MPKRDNSSYLMAFASPDASQRETFLSRVFGIQSPYNLVDNYFYDGLGDPDVVTAADAVPLGRIPSLNPLKQALNLLKQPSQLKNHLDTTPSLLHPAPPPPLPPSKSNFANIQLELDLGLDLDLDASLDLSLLDASLRPPVIDMPVPFTESGIGQSPSHIDDNVLPLYAQPTQYARRAPRVAWSLAPRPHRPYIAPRERALYLWANITNMDDFLADIYYYYRGQGMLNIALERAVDIFIFVFVVWFALFVTYGIDYSSFSQHLSHPAGKPLVLRDLIIPNYWVHCVPPFAKVLLLGFMAYTILRIAQLYFDCRYKLMEIRNFYRHLLDFSSDEELSTVAWKTIVERLAALKNFNSLTQGGGLGRDTYRNDLVSKVRLNPHDIANRIMRKENYMIGLINKQVLDMSISIPLGAHRTWLLCQNDLVFTRTLEWNLKLCIYNYIFNAHGHINPLTLKDYNRNQMAKELSARFRMAALINLVLCPFLVVYFVLLYFFRYFTEYKSNPASIIGLRQYTPYAQWKLREFNELPHIFAKRLFLSMSPATTYINQFPRAPLVVNSMKLVNFVLGAILAALVIMGLWFENEDHSFLLFELSPGRLTLLYISVFGTIWAVTSPSASPSMASSTSPNASSPPLEHANTRLSSFVCDPEASLRYVAHYTHYLPNKWRGRLHTQAVKQEFCRLYCLKILLIANELLSIIVTPFLLWFKAAASSGAIIDFFREYSVHVDGMGYVCYFAMFNFEEKLKNFSKKPSRKRSRSFKSRPSRHNDHTQEDDDEEGPDFDSDESSDTLYPQDKMTRLYMYFLKSYGNDETNHNAPGPSRAGLSLKVKPTHMSNTLGPVLGDQAVGSSTYEINYKFDESIDSIGQARNGRKAGILGMLNQFYKQDVGR